MRTRVGYVLTPCFGQFWRRNTDKRTDATLTDFICLRCLSIASFCSGVAVVRALSSVCGKASLIAQLRNTVALMHASRYCGLTDLAVLGVEAPALHASGAHV